MDVFAGLGGCGVGEKLVVEKGGGGLVGFQKPGSLAFGLLVASLQGDANFFGEGAKGFPEFQPFPLHDKGEGVAAGATGAKAVPSLTLRVYDEGGRLFVVEGARGLEVAPGLLQGHGLGYHVDDIQPASNFFYGCTAQVE